MTAYIIQIVLFQALFLGVYHLFLKRETFFNYNRLYLVLTPIISLLLPLVKIAAFNNVIPTDTIVAILPEIVLGNSSVETTAESVASGFQVSWQSVYLIGLLLSLGVFGAKLIQCMRLLKHRKNREHIITIPNSQEAFSFLNFIFMGEALDPLSRKQILAHEQVHVQEKHSWDLLIFELLRIVFWFNPLVYIYQRNIAIVHEYIADAKIAGGTTRKEYYQDLLNMTFGTQQLSFINSFFNHSFIKNRILMLQKSKSKRSAQFKYLVIIPMILSMMIYVACSSDTAAFLAENRSFEEKVAALVNNYEDNETLTKSEFDAFSKKLGTLADEDGHTDPKNADIFTKALNSMLAKLETKPSNTYSVQEVEYVQDGDIPFAVIDQVPLFLGCNAQATREEQKRCTAEGIAKHVNQNFDIEKLTANGLTGKNRVFVQFKIDKTGKVVNVRSRAALTQIQEEAERVVNSIPQMTPGSQNGVPVAVLYSLPISFYIAE